MGKGPDVRWVGNESGVGRTTEWSVIPLPTSPDKFNWPDMTGGDLGSRAKLTPGSHLWWYPAEVNTTILGNSQWFWARNKHPRTVTQLVDIYYTSVGRNGNLILNLSPDKRGLDSRQPTRCVEQDGADHQRNFRHRSRRWRQSHRRQLPTPRTVRRWRWTAISTPGGKPRRARPTAR